MEPRTPITMSPEPVCEDAERNKHWIYGFFAAGIGITSYFLWDRWLSQAALAALFGYMLTNNRYQWLYIVYKTAPRDLKAIYRFIKMSTAMKIWERRNMTVVKVFMQNVRRDPSKIAFHFENKQWTFRMMDEFSNQVAWYFKKRNFKRGDVVALMMETRPEYVGIWMGLSKIGVITALINTNILGTGLLHSIKAAACKAIIFSSEYAEALDKIRENEDVRDIPLFQYKDVPEVLDRSFFPEGGNLDPKDFHIPLLSKATSIVPELNVLPTTPQEEEIAKGNFKDQLLYIYTSGTTDLPKAAVITNSRCFMMTFGLTYMIGCDRNDIVYVPLPLYHTAGGVLGCGQAIVCGCTVVLRNKFSASNFWKDCVKYNCTTAQYIGETCRYLLAQPPSEFEKKHNIRMMFGNGLRTQIWKEFVERFRVKNIKEFYGATEGNANMINLPSKEGSIGFTSRLDQFLYQLVLVRCDENTGEILKDKDGKCVRCQPFEPGILLGRVTKKLVVSAFTGYVDKKATEKKILRDVLRQGDRYFNTGDILIMDHYGFFYFKDRTGDTFRWKGENVSTCEVEAILSNIIGLKDVIAYGVTIPNTEGRGGMAAIVDPTKQLNISDLSIRVNKTLPSYARPIFMRILPEAPLTSTFKLKKVDLVKDGFDLNKVKDDLYYLDPKEGYTPLTRSLYDNILNGKTRL